jgi:hypothetical protein
MSEPTPQEQPQETILDTKPVILVGKRGMEVQSFDAMYRMANALANSGMVPDHFKAKPAAVLAAMQTGAEIGLAPMTALQWICVIGGRPCLWGNGPKAIVQASGLVEDWQETWDEATKTATCAIKRKGQTSPIVRQFSMADAKSATLDRKTGPWMTAPARMCANRARARALNDGFADCLLGLHVAEEVQDYTPTVRRIVDADSDPLLAEPSA